MTLRRLGLAVGLAAVAGAGGWLLRPGEDRVSVSSPVLAPSASSVATGGLAGRGAPAERRRIATAPRVSSVPVPAAAPLPATADQAGAVAVPAVRSPEPAETTPPPPPAPQPARAVAVLAKTEAVTVVVKKDAVIGVRLDHAVAADRARVDDTITASISRDVVVDGITALSAGTRLEGVVTLVERGPGGREKIGIRFTMLVRADQTRLAVQTDTLFRESALVGDAQPALDTSSSAFSAVLASRSRPPVRGAPLRSAEPATAPRYHAVKLPAGASLTVQLTAPLSLTIERHPSAP